jgi:hypothetical protein
VRSGGDAMPDCVRFNVPCRALGVIEAHTMPLLFSYGTLQDESVQISLFGRALTGQKDHLLGFEQSLVRVADLDFARVSGTTHHAIVRPSRNLESRVPGMALEVTDGELEQADKYEPVEYRRVAASLASGRQAWVYVDATFTAKES